MPKHRRNEIESIPELLQHIEREDVAGKVIQGVDVSGVTGIEKADIDGCIFLGCTFEGANQLRRLREHGAVIFPRFRGLPFKPYRASLYSVDELMAGYEADGYTGTVDFSIYAHAHRERHHPDGIAIKQALAQRIHDHAIDDALMEFLTDHPRKGSIGVMGGHGTPRSASIFRQVARTTWKLTRKGYLILTGGGPGVMEAANLGSWCAGVDDPNIIDEAITILSEADVFGGGHEEGTPEYLSAIRGYIRSAQNVLERLGPQNPDAGVSLAVPTWFYGHEPTNLFATAVAKYFDNSIREEGLLAIAKAGVIYAPGSAGTMQEIFQDLTQNHYATYEFRSPMVFFGQEHYREIYQLIVDFVRARGMAAVYEDLLTLVDSEDEIVEFIEGHPPRRAEVKTPLYEIVS